MNQKSVSVIFFILFRVFNILAFRSTNLIQHRETKDHFEYTGFTEKALSKDRQKEHRPNNLKQGIVFRTFFSYQG
jgi:hypothetical protein